MAVGDWAVRQCCEIRLRAERKWRQLYDHQNKARPPAGRGAGERFDGRSSDATDRAPTLADHGVTKQQAADWGKLAATTDGHSIAANQRPQRIDIQ
jgi:hypothetical protein